LLILLKSFVKGTIILEMIGKMDYYERKKSGITY